MLSALFDIKNSWGNTSDASTVWGAWDEQTTTNAARVDRVSAMQLMAVYGSVRLISDSISTMPVDVYRRAGDRRIEVPPPRWLENPTPDLDFESWCGQVLTSLLLQGNAYVLVERSMTPGAPINSLIPLDPQTVTVERDQGRKRYRINGQLSAKEIVHLKGLMWAGSDVGLSPIECARRTIRLGLSALDYGSDFFAGEGNMPGVIELPHPAQPGTMSDLAKQWRKKRTTGGRGLPGVLQNGAQWKPTGVNHEQAQFLKTRQYSAAEIAGQLFLVDPSDLGIPVEGTSLTYANLQDRNTRRVQVTLLPWIIRLENALTELLQRPRYVKLNVNGLLRGDLKTRYEAYGIGIDHGFLLPNEARQDEDREPLPDNPIGVPE